MSKTITEEIEFLSACADEDASSPWEPTGNQETDVQSQATHSKGLAKVVAIAAILFLVLCLGLVGVTLRMSEDIDNKGSALDFDKVEVLSESIDNADEFFLAPMSSLNEQDVNILDQKEKQRKRLAFAVGLISGVLFIASVGLVAVSFYMAKGIDVMVRNSNEMLQRYNEQMSDDEITAFMNTTTPL